MAYFDTYFSATLAPTNNQKYYVANKEEVQASRTFMRLEAEGTHLYSFLYANQVASTFNHGEESYANRICAEWKILSLKASICKEKFTPGSFVPVTFEGNTEKTVHPGEIFSTDPISLTAKKGDVLCLETVYMGEEIPYLHETVLHSTRLTDGEWAPSIYTPRPVCIGCDRPVRNRVVFWGDSITEGLGTPVESYAGYAAVASRLLGEENAYWNVGLGYGRGADAASGGLWLWEASRGDFVFLCFGVNDILQGHTADEIKRNLTTAVKRLKAAGCRVCIQTVPPFDFTGEHYATWQSVNAYIAEELVPQTDFFFDNRSILCDKDGYHAKYGGHPNEEGCAAWGEGLSKAVTL